MSEIRDIIVFLRIMAILYRKVDFFQLKKGRFSLYSVRFVIYEFIRRGILDQRILIEIKRISQMSIQEVLYDSGVGSIDYIEKFMFF